jgi:hypothetical protein
MFMTERSLYARLGVLIAGLCLLAVGAAAQTPVQGCAACTAVTIQTGQVLLLPEDLHGITILLLDDGATADSLVPLVELVRDRGGVPGVVVGRTAEEDDYRLRLRLTELRATLPPGVLLVLEAPVLETSTPYADVAVGPAGGRSPSGLRYWHRLDTPTVAAALAASAAGGAEKWVLAAPQDVIAALRVLHELAAAAAPRADVLTDSVEVRGLRRFTADEIVARHQAFARLQASRVARTISSGRLTLTFEAPGFAAPVTISSETVIYTTPDRVDLEQRGVEVNGIAFTGSRVPKLPILEPERAAAPPLTITLTGLYRYRLEPDALVDGVRCHVVSFEPRVDDESLFTGRAWIAADTFAMVQVAATQTNLRGAIVSSEQVDTYRAFESGLWLLARSDVRQLYEGPAHRTPIHRLLTITSHELDPGDFDARLEAAYRSPSIMLRDTPEGYRYLDREFVTDTAGGAPAEIRVSVAERSTRIRTLAGGVIIDPNISVPLPFAGLSYVDFDLFGTGTQLSAFFGGSYAQLAFSVPSLGGSRWQLAGRAFGIASSYNDRSFRDGREIYDENLRQRPAHASAWLLRPVSPRVSIRAGYEFDYTHLRSAPETSPAFEIPGDQVVHGLRLGLEGQRAGWAASAWWNPAWRQGWRAWGRAEGRTGGDYSPDHARFQRFGASLSRSAAPSSRLVTKVEIAAMAGADLDRFSRFAFGTFDNRLRGYPSALIRYDRGGVIRLAAAWSAGRFVRLDGFADTAYVRDRGYGRRYRNYTGVGAAIESPAPFGMLAALEWGYGLRGLDADGSRGTHVIRVSAYKMF